MAEQDSLMKSNELSTTLAEGLKLLPNVQNITIGAHPRGDFYCLPGVVEQKVAPRLAYNKLRR